MGDVDQLSETFHVGFLEIDCQGKENGSIFYYIIKNKTTCLIFSKDIDLKFVKIFPEW